jgi:hypothetical protein
MSNKEEIPWTWGDGGQPPSPPPEAMAGQRFLACGYDAEMKPFADGNWISYNDYSKLLHERIHDIQQIGGLQEDNARLKAEVEELKSQPDPLTAYLYADTLRRDDIKTLKAHIERLTKAGDAMLSEWASGDEKDAKNFLKALVIWNAAKEGNAK